MSRRILALKASYIAEDFEDIWDFGVWIFWSELVSGDRDLRRDVEEFSNLGLSTLFEVAAKF